MSKTKELLDKYNYENPLGEEHRVYIKWMEEEEYNRYPEKDKK